VARPHALRRTLRTPRGELELDTPGATPFVTADGVLVDVTPMRATLAALRSSEELNRAVLAALAEGLVVLDGEAAPVMWNASAVRLLDGPPTDLPALLEGGAERVEVRRGDRWLVVHRRPLGGPGGGTVCTIEDVTEIRRLAYHDRLTGLPNRALLEEHLALAVARARREGTAIALLSLDLDGFGLVNDSLGHAAGDEVLRGVARRLRGVTRASDLLARPDGDQFVLLLADLPDAPADAANVAARVLAEALAEPFRLDGAEFQLTASIGVSLLPEHADNADDLLRRADVAMEQAKRRGSGPAFFAPAPVDARTRLSLSTRLRTAIARDELALHFQPLCDPAGGPVVAAEALIRWQDPERGLVPPGAFIPAAEETGVIEAIGEWVLDALCRQAAAWAPLGAGGAGLRLSFNLSPRELRRPDLVEAIAGRVAAAGLDPAGFCVEVTESSAMAQPERTTPLLRALSAAGFALAIDDFGAGHSSLSRLKDLPFGLLKIDRSFLRGVPHDPEATAIVAAVLGLGSALGLTTVAEGVETEEQRAFLVGHGCPLAQGYLLGRPMPASALEERLRTEARA
jgi:diguanylate cyclase (GGDEF)-like protein